MGGDAGTFIVEYAKSNRLKCATCRGIIAQGTLRIGVFVQSPKFDGPVPKWNHDTCFQDRWLLKDDDAKAFTSLEKIAGFSTLKMADQQRITQLVKKTASGKIDADADDDDNDPPPKRKNLEAEAALTKAMRDNLKGTPFVALEEEKISAKKRKREEEEDDDNKVDTKMRRGSAKEDRPSKASRKGVLDKITVAADENPSGHLSCLSAASRMPDAFGSPSSTVPRAGTLSLLRSYLSEMWSWLPASWRREPTSATVCMT